MRHAKWLNLSYWQKALQTTMYVLNISGSCVHDGKTPFELWIGWKPFVDHLRVFGSFAYVQIPKELRKKLDSKSLKVVFVWYYTHSKVYHFWDIKRMWIIVSRDVIFDESSMVDDITTFESSFKFLYNLQCLRAMPLVETSQPNNVPTNEIIIGQHMLELNSSVIQAHEILVANQYLQVDE